MTDQRANRRRALQTVRRRRIRRAVPAAAVVALGSVLAGCSGSPSGNIGYCGWPQRADAAQLNVAYPDAGASYFTTRYGLVGGQKLVIQGAFPFARYISFITYNLQGNVIDSISDAAIAPDPGSDNPFATVGASADPLHRRFTVTIDTDAGVSAGDNVLAAGAGVGAAVGAVIMRVYVPDDPGDPRGGVALPDIIVSSPDGSSVGLSPCPSQGVDTSIIDLINIFGPPTDLPALDPPVFRRPLSTGGLYANPDNTYLAVVVDHQPDSVIVVRGVAPSTPDTRGGQSPATPSQLRYWSLCTNQYVKPYPVTDCAFDHQVPLDGGGAYTVVVSTPSERPSNANLASGVQWLDWGTTAVKGLLLFRNMLPAPSFTQSAFAVAPGDPAAPTMGPYAPIARYCATATFESGGAAACGL